MAKASRTDHDRAPFRKPGALGPLSRMRVNPCGPSCNFADTLLTISESYGRQVLRMHHKVEAILGWGGFFFVGRERYGKMPTH